MSATDILKLCDEVLAASKGVTPLPWRMIREDGSMLCIEGDDDKSDHSVGWFVRCHTCAKKEYDGSFNCGWPKQTDANYICISANCAPALAEYIRRLHEAAAERGIDIDTWDLPRQPR